MFFKYQEDKWFKNVMFLHDSHVNVRTLQDNEETYRLISVHRRTKREPSIQRSRQDSILRGDSPMDFKSIALTTRPQPP